MKKFIILLILAGIGYGIYHYKDEIMKMVDGGGDKGAEDGSTPPATPGGPAEPQADKAQPSARPAPAAADPIAQRYPMPVFKPIEELVGNWDAVPATAFPREVTLKKQAKFVIAGGAGSTTVPAGRKAVALALTAGQLVIAPRKGSTVRGRIAVDDTTFKAELASAYDGYKKRKKQEVLDQRKRARTLAANSPPEPSPRPSSTGNNRVTIQRSAKPPRALLSEYERKLGPMPARAKDDRVTLMVQSIRNGDVSEIKLDAISRWGPVRYELVDNQPYWTGTVSYKTHSLFGTFDTEAMALMRNGKVVTWVYTGSLEEVP